MTRISYWLLVISYWLLLLGLFFYSFTQVDLNLTLSRVSFIQNFQKFFMQTGYFNRPLSTGIFLLLVFLLFTFYFLFLWLVKNEKITEKQLWLLIIMTVGILLFSYPAFSHDVFNYMFDARILTFHHQNPYLHKALDYPSDPWTNFMHWTHRTYPYGPVWLGLTIPLSFLGFQFFLPTLFLFKSFMTINYLGTIYFIGKILEKTSPTDKKWGIAFFAFNPLVIIETLVSGHHEIVMIFLMILAIYFLLSKKYLRAIFFFILSINIKFATIFLLPIFIIVAVFQIKKKKIPWEKIFLGGIFLMLMAVILAIKRTELQPWYLLWLLPLASFLPKKRWLVIPSVTLSLGLLLYYAPFLYLGNWNEPVPIIKLWLTGASILVGFLICLAVLIGKNFSLKNFFAGN